MRRPSWHGASQAADEAEALPEHGFRLVKLRLGRATAAQGLAVVRAVILAEPLRIADGMAQVPDQPGSGVAWNPDVVKRYRIA